MTDINISQIYSELTSNKKILNIEDKLFSFAKELNWNPSYCLQPDKINESFANGYLTIEHGLESTAVLAFLNKPYFELTPKERKKLDSIAYNNLVPWLIPFEKGKRTDIFILNSTEKRIVNEQRIFTEEIENLRYDNFLKIIGNKPNSNTPALDESLISSISDWKKKLSDIPGLNNEDLSLLFNTIIFIRAIEDSNRRYKNQQFKMPLLLDICDKTVEQNRFSLTEIFKEALVFLKQEPSNTSITDLSKLEKFNILRASSIERLFENFYETENNRFTYDFSIMTKHALSRIYERYVSILQIEDEADTEPILFTVPKLLVEKRNKNTGTYYTPEYIARFFAKYILKEFQLKDFNKLKIAEPAIGSGIFLRTLLEVYFERNNINVNPENKQIFDNITGVDSDANACQATKLSLSLLHLNLFDSLPDGLKIIKRNSLEFFNNQSYLNKYDIVISNPPYVSYENLSDADKEILTQYLNSKGKPDLYLGFIKIAIDILKPNGLGLLILPYSFLINQSAEKIRKYLAQETIIKLVADLSAVPVFGNVGIYVILLIFQKKSNYNTAEKSIVLQCKTFSGTIVGEALEDILNKSFKNDETYSIYEFEQNDFQKNEWNILPPKEYNIEKKIETFPKIEKYLEVKQGFITGADSIFLRDRKEIPKGEENIYLPYLPDKEMQEYCLPKQVNSFVFYPYIYNIKITEDQLQKKYNQTWSYLLQNKPTLENRKSVSSEWWMPTSPRLPEFILQPKIITPHLSIMPKFSLDIEGKFGVTRTPYFILKKNEPNILDSSDDDENTYDVDEKDLLYYFLGILNSTPCYWYIANHSHKYASGYNMLEVLTLKNTPIPPPEKVNIKDKMKLIKLVKDRLAAKEKDMLTIEKEIDRVVCRLYNLTEEETKLLVDL